MPPFATNQLWREMDADVHLLISAANEIIYPRNRYRKGVQTILIENGAIDYSNLIFKVETKGICLPRLRRGRHIEIPLYLFCCYRKPPTC